MRFLSNLEGLGALSVLLTLGVAFGMAVTPVLDASAWIDKMIRRAMSAGDDWLKGMENPSADPKAAAIKAAGKYKQRTTESLNEDRWAKGMARVDTDAALATARKVGAAGYAAGIEARREKIAKRIQELQPKILALKNKLDAMPVDTDAQREQKMIAARRGMIEIGKQLRGA